jgi:tyrosyl-tRNA synthetase
LHFGGATGMIGDPSGKSDEKLVGRSNLEHNVEEGIKKGVVSFSRF